VCYILPMKNKFIKHRHLLSLSIFILIIITHITLYFFTPKHITLLITSLTITLILTFIISLTEKRLHKNKNITKALKQKREKQLRELDMARQIQQSLLASNTLTTKEISIFASCKPADKIGGDFYTINERNLYKTVSDNSKTKGIIELQSDMNRLVNICIGDVAGHGVASALVMLLTQSLIGKLFQQYTTPVKIFELANKEIKKLTEESEISFVTSALMQIDLDTKIMTYAKAGHTDSLLIHDNGEIESLSTDGIFLGMFDDPKYEEKQIQLKSRDTIVCYTDGITETRSPNGELYGVQRFQEFLSINKNMPAKKLIQNIYEELEKFSKSKEISDDSTILIISIS
jgi:phosphoserine phosphatase RsbU/P